MAAGEEASGGAKVPAGAQKRLPLMRVQKPMTAVLVALTPAMLSAIYRFGWRSAAVLAAVTAACFFAEWTFTRKRKEPVSEAVFVTAMLLTLTLPPTIPYWIAVVGGLTAIYFGKEFFGGFGRNVFNPALVGRCFIYICFPISMTGRWGSVASGWPGGFARWSTQLIDASATATPLVRLKTLGPVDLKPYMDFLIGERAGCMGETAALAILLGAAYLLVRKVADWRLMTGCVGSAFILSGIFWLADGRTGADPLWSILAGGFLFGSVFMITDPVSASRTPAGKWIYGACVGTLTVLMRRLGVFPEGIMFAILFMNAFNPAIDIGIKAATKPAGKAAA